MFEVEVKIKVHIDKARTFLNESGFLENAKVYEYDRYFNGKDIDLKLADKALRIREHKDLKTQEVIYELNYKGPKIDNITMTRQEVQFCVPSFEMAEVMLNGLGFYVAGSVEKTRAYYIKDDITCCLDSVSGLGDFLEIEIMAQEDKYDDAILKIETLLSQMDLSMEDTIRQSYLSMLAG